jgi:serine/threonine protein kinase
MYTDVLSQSETTSETVIPVKGSGDIILDGRVTLGSGTFSTVFLGVFAAKQVVAVKVIHLPPLDGEERQKTTSKFLKETKALEQLRHPNIVNLVASTCTQSSTTSDLVIAMEFMGGGTLFKLLSDSDALVSPSLQVRKKRCIFIHSIIQQLCLFNFR